MANVEKQLMLGIANTVNNQGSNGLVSSLRTFASKSVDTLSLSTKAPFAKPKNIVGFLATLGTGVNLAVSQLKKNKVENVVENRVESSETSTTNVPMRTTEESIEIVNTIFRNKDNADKVIGILCKNPVAFNTIPLKKILMVTTDTRLLNAIVKNWKAEYSQIPWERISSFQTVKYIHSLMDISEQFVVIEKGMCKTQVGQDGNYGTFSYFDFTELKNEDGSFNSDKVLEFYKQIAIDDKNSEFREIKAILAAYGNIEDFCKNFPKLSSKLLELLEKGYFSPNGTKLQTILKSKDFAKDLEIVEKYLNEGYQSVANSFTRIHTEAGSYFVYKKFDNFNKLPKDLQEQIIKMDCCYRDKNDVSSRFVFTYTVKHIDDINILSDLCSDSKKIEKYSKEKIYADKLFEKQKDISKELKYKILINLIFMKSLYPQEYNKLITSKGYKDIKSGVLSAKILENLRYDDKIDDLYFYRIFENIENNGKRDIELLHQFENYSPENIKAIIELDPSRQDEIINAIYTAKDNKVMAFVLNIVQKEALAIKTNIKNNEKNKFYVDPTEIFEANKNLIDFVIIAANEPEIIRFSNQFTRNCGTFANFVDKLSKTKLDEDLINKAKNLMVAHKKYLTASTCTQMLNFLERVPDVELLETLLSKYAKLNFLRTILSNINKNNVDFVREVINDPDWGFEELPFALAMKDLEDLSNPDREDAVIETAYQVAHPLRANLYKEISQICNERDKKVAEIKSSNNDGSVLQIINKINRESDEKCFQLCVHYLYKYQQWLPLVDVKLNKPDEYQKILDSGILDMILSNKVDSHVLHKFNRNSMLNDNIYNDLEIVKSGKSIVTEFEAGTSKEEAFAQSKCGDVVSIGTQMYINDGKELFEWSLSKEQYLKLFPPIERFATTQGSLGDCYLVSSLISCMENPTARAQLYKLFKANGEDITVTIKAYEEYGGSYTFKNGEIELDEQNRHLTGCKGLQMLEQTYARVSLREEKYDYLPSLTEDISKDSMMMRIKSGNSHIALSEILGLESLGTQKFIPKDFSKATLAMVLDSKNKFHLSQAEKIIKQYANNKDFILNFGTKEKENAQAESTFLKEYNLVSKHGYSIIGYDEASRIVKMINPHEASEVVEIPLDKLLQYVKNLYLVSLK